MRKRFSQVVLLAIGVAAFVLSSCGDVGGPRATTDVIQMEQIKKRKSLVVAVHPDAGHRMFCYESILPEGFDIDLGRHLAKELGQRLGIEGFEAEFYYVRREGAIGGWTRLLSMLQEPEQDSFDIAIASISKTEEREEKGIVFSTPYLRTGLGVIRKRGKASKEIELKDRFPIDELIQGTFSIGVHENTTAHTLMNQLLPENKRSRLVVVDTNEQLFSWKNDRGEPIDVIIYDYIRSITLVHAAAGRWTLQMLEQRENVVPPEMYCVAMSRKNDELRKHISEILGATDSLPEPGSLGVSCSTPEVTKLIKTRVDYAREDRSGGR